MFAARLAMGLDADADKAMLKRAVQFATDFQLTAASGRYFEFLGGKMVFVLADADIDLN